MLRAVKAEIARRAAEVERERIARDGDLIKDRCVRLAGFVREAWSVLEPTAVYRHNWHIDAICEHLEAITFGRMTPRLLINVPPGSSKSLLVSVLWQAWEWGPCGLRSSRFLTTAFNEGPVKRDTRKTRDLIQSEWFQALWPEVQLTRTAEMSFANNQTGTREGVPFGSLTSQRGDRLIIDDPHSTETAESEAERTATTRKFREGALNRLNDQERSAIVVVMQRLHEQDVSGTILKLGMGFEHLMLPMEFEPARRCGTSIGFHDPRELDGDLLDPVRFSRPVVEDLKTGLGSYAYAGQYQQRPVPREGGLFKRHWFDVVEALPADMRWVRAWDLAGTRKTAGNAPDWTVGAKLGRAPNGVFYVADVVRFQGSPGDVEQSIRNRAALDGRGVAIRLPQDPGQAGKAQAETLVRMLAGYDVRAKPVTGDKETRARPAAAQAEAGNVKVLAAPWANTFLDEVCTFPAAAHDDQVDAFADALNELALGPGPVTSTPLRI